jgi:hypothetical protein
MTQTSFWNLRSPESTARLAEWASGEVNLETVICPIKDGHQHVGGRLSNLSVVLPGGAVQDFVWTWYSECLLQDRVLELFKKNGFTGYDVKPVKARFKRAGRQEPPRLWELIVTGWAGMASPESGIRLVERCKGCGHAVYSGSDNSGAVIDVSRWDGSDFFMVWPLPAFVFVTKRVAQTIRSDGLTGAVLKEPKELDLSGEFSPGRLSYSMPLERARELGAALGVV